MRRIDPDAERLGDRLGIAAPQPGAAVRSGKPLPPVPRVPWHAAQLSPKSVPPASRTVCISAGSALIAAKSISSIRFVHTDRSALASSTWRSTVVLWSIPSKPLRVGPAQRPGRHEDPVSDREQGRDDEKEDHDPRHRGIEFLDAVPFMARRHAAGDGIAFAYFHGLSSSSRMLFFASWNRFRFDGQKA